jgi:hypothetical protein
VAYASGAPTYASGTTYAKYATVTYSGTVYASTQASNTGREPDLNVPTWWTPYQFSASSVEVMRITAITPGTPPAGTVTVVRGDISQLGSGIGSAYSSGQVVTFTDLPNLTYFAESFYVNARASFTTDPNNGAPTAVAAQNTITSTSTSNNSGALIH